MKLPLFLIALLYTWLLSMPACASDAVAATSVDVIVERWPAELPAGEGAARSFLWSSFSKGAQTAAYSDLRVRGWREVAKSCRAALASKARAMNLEADALDNILNEILSARESVAIVPIAAYRGHQGEKPIWIIVTKWELDSGEATPPQIRLGHVQIGAYEIATQRRLASASCM